MKQKGYIAVSTILVITVVVFLMGMTVTMNSIGELQKSLASKKSEEAFFVAESCIEEKLLKLAKGEILTENIALPIGNCDVTIDTETASNVVFTVLTNIENYQKEIRVEVDKSNDLQIVDYREI